jgi:hypothetical protein
MTRTIQLDIPEPLYKPVVKAASANGTTAEEWILKTATARLPAPVEPSEGTEGETRRASDPFRDAFGTIHSGNPHSADNEAIDADLARVYGGLHDEE